MFALEGEEVKRAAARGLAAASFPSSATTRIPPRVALDPNNNDGAARTASTALRVLPHWRSL